MAQNVAILLKFPSVQTLRIRGLAPVDSSGLDIPTSGFLPLLQEYTGPGVTLPMFLPLSTLTRLTTYDIDPRPFIAVACQLSAPSRIISLDLSFNEFDNIALDKLSAVFIWLTELRIHITMEQDINGVARSFFQKLADAPTLPQQLERLVLTWKFEYEAEVPTCGPQLDLGYYRDVLLARCPKLIFVWLDADDFLLQWHRLRNDTIDERIANDVDEVHNIRPELDILWDSF
ncbi:hypothetical protein B0H17DRAFT_1201789 [Mycena rosella]|uniref:Uncharacterized protein n=1 Tax=Mycena rosella TaxID=1033263 RepID=A0AAD7DF49_MYCRO|nr:hypothetical protein B0H17DRAFT_1201789 [Mycena rosella]